MESPFGERMRELDAIRRDRLGGAPSDRAVAKHLKMSPTTVGKWLRGVAFPQDLDKLLKLVEAVGVAARRRGALDDDIATAFDPEDWRRVYREEATRRAGQVSAAVSAALAQSSLMRDRPGRPIDHYNAWTLEVHRAIDIPHQRNELSALPLYVRRPHDAELSRAVATAVNGSSVMVTLVGGSSTGKTRALWEAIQTLPEYWRLWHPIDPSRPRAVIDALERLAPHTVVWLNEAQHYLLDRVLGEQVAASLRSLLIDDERNPVIILGTLWREYWDMLTKPPAPGDDDPHAQARQLLTKTDVTVPESFSAADLREVARQANRDPRLSYAMKHAETGRITQQLAGVPQLLQRYRNAPPEARALINAAMDARRFGHPARIPLNLLAKAAPGYLSDHEWGAVGDDWLIRAVDYCAAPCHGTPGPVTRIRPRPNESSPPGVEYRLADYLEQAGRSERATVFPPDSFWQAVATTTVDPTTVQIVAHRAYDRGRFRRAVQLYRIAAERGENSALNDLADIMEQGGNHREAMDLWQRAAELGEASAVMRLMDQQVDAGNIVDAETLASRADALGDTDAVRQLAMGLVGRGETAIAEHFLELGAANGNLRALSELAEIKDRQGDSAAAEALFHKAAQAGDTQALWPLAKLRRQAGDIASAASLYRRLARLGESTALQFLAEICENEGDAAEAERIANEAATVGDTSALRALAQIRERSGKPDGAERMAIRAATFGDTRVLWSLAIWRERAGNVPGALRMYRRAADQGDNDALWALARRLENAGDSVGAEALIQRAADNGDAGALAGLAMRRKRSGDLVATEALLRQSAGLGNASALYDLVQLLEESGDPAGARELLQQAAEDGDTAALWALAWRRDAAGDRAAAEALVRGPNKVV